jgi:hypothetical protein
MNLRLTPTESETRTRRTGFLALAVSFSAGIHAALVPEHLEELPALGYAFIVAAVIGGVLAWALVSRPHDRRLPLLAAVFCLGEIGAWALFVTMPAGIRRGAQVCPDHCPGLEGSRGAGTPPRASADHVCRAPQSA